jgi:uncharacterized protein
MAEYKTPGVYVEEVSTFPTSVVRVATAVPVFLGVTETNYKSMVPVKIRSLVEYERLYGGEPPDQSAGRTLDVTLSAAPDYAITAVNVSSNFSLYQSVRLFYANGGGDAYILSLNDYDDGMPHPYLYTDAVFTALSKIDEPTLVLAPDAWHFDKVDLGVVQKKMLAHCANMQDRFAILDIVHDTGNTVAQDVGDFRDEIGTLNLKYGAAYYPELLSTLGPTPPTSVYYFSLNGGALTLDALGAAIGDDAIIGWTAAKADYVTAPLAGASFMTYRSNYDGLSTPVTLKTQLVARMDLIKDVVDHIYNWQHVVNLTNLEVQDLIARIADGVDSPLAILTQKMVDYDMGFPVGFPVGELGSVDNLTYGAYSHTSPGSVPAIYGPGPGYTEAGAAGAATSPVDHFKALFDEAYGYLLQIFQLVQSLVPGNQLFTTSWKVAEINSALVNTGYRLPPCGAIAGIYAVNDATKGVWHAPANMSLNAVREVARKIQSVDLDDLNIPALGNGKAVNAIRPFQGKGVLVYGARTLAGNDNEWRYVPVRRLFNMVEESVKKASEPYVFEPNDGNTWVKVKGMIENFLLGLWRDGALAGAVPKDAFFVKVGLGQTMTADDILNGKMIIEIGMAAVRPAEFVILKFSHKMQES